MKHSHFLSVLQDFLDTADKFISNNLRIIWGSEKGWTNKTVWSSAAQDWRGQSCNFKVKKMAAQYSHAMLPISFHICESLIPSTQKNTIACRHARVQWHCAWGLKTPSELFVIVKLCVMLHVHFSATSLVFLEQTECRSLWMSLKRYGCSHTLGMQQMAALSPLLPPLKMKITTTIANGVVPSFYKFF